MSNISLSLPLCHSLSLSPTLSLSLSLSPPLPLHVTLSPSPTPCHSLSLSHSMSLSLPLPLHVTLSPSPTPCHSLSLSHSMSLSPSLCGCVLGCLRSTAGIICHQYGRVLFHTICAVHIPGWSVTFPGQQNYQVFFAKMHNCVCIVLDQLKRWRLLLCQQRMLMQRNMMS